MDSLPNEIIELILKNSSLDIKDIVNFSSTCTKFRDVVNDSSVVWKSKYFQRWPPISVPVVTDNWKQECMLRRDLERKMYKILSEMSAKFYSVSSVADEELSFVTELLDSYKYGYYYAIHYLIQLNKTPLYGALTIMYYAEKLLKFVKKRHLTKVWQHITSQPVEEHILEKAAIFSADWFQLTEESIEKNVISQLNMAADLVRKNVKSEFKDHPLNKVSEETFQEWEKKNLQGNMFQPISCKQIITCINNVLFHLLNYCYESDMNIELYVLGIDHAVTERKTTPLVLGIIYESVARRLGVKCEMINFPAHTLVRWRENYENDDSPYFYIDMSGKGAFLSSDCCARNSYVINRCPVKRSLFPSLNMRQVAERSVLSRRGNLSTVRAVLELMLVLSPHDIDCYLELGRYYMSQEMDVRGLISKLKEITTRLSERELLCYKALLSSFQIYSQSWEQIYSTKIQAVKHRTDDIEFAVGMIGLHKRYNYTCVVYGWDPVCTASPEWIQEMGVQNLPKKDQQPFYNVLANDGSVRYVAQENLQMLHFPPLVCHPDIGRYFEEYCTTHYKPNKELETEYPEDAAALEKLLRKHGEHKSEEMDLT